MKIAVTLASGQLNRYCETTDKRNRKRQCRWHRTNS